MRNLLRQIRLIALATAIVSAPRFAVAQIDTPAAALARAALGEVVANYGDRQEWVQWSILLNVPDVRYELHAGDRAEPAALQAAILQLLAGRVRQFSEPPFARLAKALDVRVQQLMSVAPADWPSACNAQADAYAPVTAEMVVQARGQLARRLDQFEQWLPSVREAGDLWNTFLHWPETRALATPARPGPAPEAALLDRLESRWTAAPTVWEDELLFETSLAVRSYICLVRGYLKGETREQHKTAWNELAELLVAYAADKSDTSRIAAAVIARQRLGQSSRLTASIRRELSRPNLVVQVSRNWLQSQFAQKINERYDVDGVFGGTRSTGSGRMVGAMRAEVLPSTAVGQWLLRIRGVSTARASGSQDRVSVVSRATTQVAATKPFVLDARGLAPKRASAGAITSIVYESINAGGIARRRSIAISETYARRPQAEAESAVYARRQILEQINREAAKVAEEFNRSYHADVRDRRINSNRPGPLVRVRSDNGSFRWECLLEGPATFGAPAPPPPFDAGTDVVLCLAASALEEQAIMMLAGRQMSGAELLKSMRPALGKSDSPSDDDFNVTFAADPCDIRFHDGVIHARLRITKFDSADVKYPAMTVDAAYKPLERDGQVVFVRQGRLRVTPIAQSQGGEPKISGRQQTLRLAVERKLGKVLSEELQWSDVAMPLSTDDKNTLRIERAQVVAPWLQVGLTQHTKS